MNSYRALTDTPGRRRPRLLVTGMGFPVRVHPVPDRLLVHIQLTRDLRDRTRPLDDLFRRFLLELRTKRPALSWHYHPHLPNKNLSGSTVRNLQGISVWFGSRGWGRGRVRVGVRQWCGVDDADMQVLDQEQDVGSGVGSGVGFVRR